MKINEDNIKKIIEELKKLMHIIEISYNDKSEGSEFRELEKCVQILEDKTFLENKKDAKFIKEFLSRSLFFSAKWAFDDLEFANGYGEKNLSKLADLCESEFAEIDKK